LTPAFAICADYDSHDFVPQFMRRVSSKTTKTHHPLAKASEEMRPLVHDFGPLGQRSLERIGNTPLLRLERATRDLPGVEILGKAEWCNPGGSVKDRAASNIVAEARASGNFGPGQILLDSTSGNTGIAYAMIGAAEGFPVTLCMPENVSVERKRILHAYGANIIYTDPADGSDGAIRAARELYAKHPDKYFYANQYGNDANWRAHYHGTANEIWQQTEGRITHFVSMMGTSGTFVGTTRRLKELNPKIRCISLQPDSPFHGIEGAKHMASAIVPKIYDPTLANQDIGISTEDAYAMAIRLAREEGLLVGISAAAAVVGCLQVAHQLKKNEPAVFVTILCDSGDKYLSERFWEEG
jgi:S-sulfo-L-cysteine synthase (O-acetyl-L-serine-dependent)